MMLYNHCRYFVLEAKQIFLKIIICLRMLKFKETFFTYFGIKIGSFLQVSVVNINKLINPKEIFQNLEHYEI